MNTKHAPTPWTAYKSTTRFHLEDKEGTVLAINGGMIPTDADAAFIVRACNAHDELVDATDKLAEFLAGVLKQDGFQHDKAMLALTLIDRADAALAKAKGE